MRIVSHDASRITIGGLAGFEIVGWHGETLIATDPLLELTAAIELGKRPSIRLLAREYARSCGTARDGRLVAVLGLKKKSRHVRVFPKSLAMNGAINLLPTKNVEFAAAGFVDDRVVALPGDMGTHRRFHERAQAQQPYAQAGKRLAPLEGGAAGDAYDLAGVMGDLVVWGGRIFELRDGALVRAFPFDLERSFTNFGLTTAVVGDSFFTVSNRRLIEVAPGARAPKVHLPKSTFRLVRPGPPGKLLLEAVEPDGLWLYEPKRKAASKIPAPAETYAFTAFYCAARKAIGAVATRNDGTAGRHLMFAAL